MSKASIIIPYFKKKKYFKQTINSILKQSYKNFEIIIIYDDYDKTEIRFIKYIKSLDKRIKLIINSKNIGAGYSRNKGIDKSSGKYICFIDADDIWKKNKLLFQINFMKQNKYLATHTSYEIINTKNKVIGRRFASTLSDFNKLLTSCDIGLSTVILDKKILKKNIKFGKIKTKEDYVLWLRILKSKIIIHSINKIFTQWRDVPKSLSSSFFQKLIDAFKVYNQYMGFNYLKSIYFVLLLSINYFRKNYLN
jgi:teichuronic acid biosynthesis glycosyltransferase TuaG